MTAARMVQAPAVPERRAIDLAFFTTGDDGGANSPPDLVLTMEEMWQRRAESLAPGHAHGVGTLAEATQVIETLDPQFEIGTVFFLGHGSGDDFGFFFFSGHPDPVENFAAASEDQVLEISRADMQTDVNNPNREFLITLFKRLAKRVPEVDQVRILFLACFMGRGETHQAICDFLDGWLVGAREITYEVGAYRNYYETVFVTDTHGHLLHWEDRIVDTPGPGATVLVPNPGPDQIPPFEVRCSGTMVGTP